jgi:hypothetical protein
VFPGKQRLGIPATTRLRLEKSRFSTKAIIMPNDIAWNLKASAAGA